MSISRSNTSWEAIGGAAAGDLGTAGHTAWRSIGAGLAVVVTLLVKELEFRRSMRALADMDEHMLRDIGLVPGEIECVVRHGRLSLR